MGRRARRPILTIAALLVLAACGGERTLDGSQLERDISSRLLPEHPGMVRSVACPDTADPLPGMAVLCLATLGDEVIDVNVVLEGEPGALSARASISERFVAVNEVAALLAATFGDDLGLVTAVDCGRPVVLLAPDETVVCDASDPSGVVRSFDVSVDDQGLVSVHLR